MKWQSLSYVNWGSYMDDEKGGIETEPEFPPTTGNGA